MLTKKESPLERALYHLRRHLNVCRTGPEIWDFVRNSHHILVDCKGIYAVVNLLR